MTDQEETLIEPNEEFDQSEEIYENSDEIDKERNKLSDYIIFNNGKDDSVNKEVLKMKAMFISENDDIISGVTKINIRNDKARKILKEMLNRNDFINTKL